MTDPDDPLVDSLIVANLIGLVVILALLTACAPARPVDGGCANDLWCLSARQWRQLGLASPEYEATLTCQPALFIVPGRAKCQK